MSRTQIAKQEAALREIEEQRAGLIARVNAKMDGLRELVISGEVPARAIESVWSLDTLPELFKGRKPAAVIFGDERVPATQWRKVYTLILKYCNEDLACHLGLMKLRNKIHGRCRTVLSDKPDGMDCAIEVCEGLYAEGDFDTGALMRMLTTGILDPAGYDYRDISIVLARKGDAKPKNRRV